MRVRSELVSQEATCTVESVACTQESCLAVSTPYRYMATGFSYLFSTAFVLVFLALGFAASATIITILVGVLGGFN